MSRANVEKLNVLEELGHRFHGRVSCDEQEWQSLRDYVFCQGSVNALNENGKRIEVKAEEAARKPVLYWNQAYDKWLPAASLGKWGGGDAIVMPDLEKMSVTVDRTLVLLMLEQTMKRRFFERNLWHGDPSWRNVALIRNESGDISKVCMIDLEPVRMIEKVETSKWQAFSTMWTEFRKLLEEDWENFEVVESAAETWRLSASNP